MSPSIALESDIRDPRDTPDPRRDVESAWAWLERQVPPDPRLGTSLDEEEISG